MGFLRRRRREAAPRPFVPVDPWDWDEVDDDPERSLLEIEEDPEMIVAQSEVDSEPLTPRSAPPPDPYGAW